MKRKSIYQLMLLRRTFQEVIVIETAILKIRNDFQILLIIIYENRRTRNKSGSDKDTGSISSKPKSKKRMTLINKIDGIENVTKDVNSSIKLSK